MFLCNITRPHEVIAHTFNLLDTSFGSMKAEIQKLTVLQITEDINCNLPAKVKAFVVQWLNLLDIASNRGEYSDFRSFLWVRGSPKYRKGKDP